MGNRQKAALPPLPGPEWLRSRFTVPSWLSSVLLQVVVLMVLSATLEFQSFGQSEEFGREVGIVLKRSSDETDVYDTPPEVVEVASVEAVMPPEAPSESPPVDFAKALPTPADPVLGIGLADLPDVDEMLRAQATRVRSEEHTSELQSH